MPKSLRYRNCTYLLNALGEETGHETIPQAVRMWHEQVAMGTYEPFWLEYLVRLDGCYGIALIQEVAHAECDNNDEYGVVIVETNNAVLQRINERAAEIEQAIGSAGSVYVGQETGIFGRHELLVFVPIHTSFAAYKAMRDSLAGSELEAA